MSRALNALICLLLCCLGARAAENLTFTYDGPAAPIPDENPTGLATSFSIDVPPELTIERVEVHVDISGTPNGFNGDLYMTLVHDSGFAVLLNRPGAVAGFPSGYSDSGINVTFGDSTFPDVHNYRIELNGSSTTPLDGPLTGSWSADGRDVDPDLVLDTSSRTALLSSFEGLPARGTWTLFVSDLSAGGSQHLDGWSIDALIVPEPSPILLVAVSALIICIVRRVRP